MNKKWLESIKSGYACSGDTVFLGCGMLDGEISPEAVVQIPLAMMNRHGLIAGATGTGKTKTLQMMAEQLSDCGVPVFLADIKGDVSGIVQPGETNPKVAERAVQLGMQWQGCGYPAEFYSLTGALGAPVRATVSSFGPLLFAKALGLSDTQADALTMVFKFCDDHGLLLLDLKDLKATLGYLADEGKASLKEYGLLSSSTAGVLLREIIKLEALGAGQFFGEPEFDPADLFRKNADGRAVISVLEVSDMQDRPELFSTFMMWLLAKLYHDLPEAGDLDKPKLVFFLDEAHLLFNDASKEFLDEVQRIVRLIRSKGIGVFFITQSPKDVPADVLAQLGSRVQHALRAFTPNDQKALHLAAQTYPDSEFYDLEKSLTALGIGEAAVTVLNAGGVPTPVALTRIAPPRSRMAPADAAVIQGLIGNSTMRKKYGAETDRESAYEILLARHQTVGDGADADASGSHSGGTLADEAAKFKSLPPPPAPKPVKEVPTAASQAGGWLMKEAGRQAGRVLVRGAMGVLLGAIGMKALGSRRRW